MQNVNVHAFSFVIKSSIWSINKLNYLFKKNKQCFFSKVKFRYIKLVLTSLTDSCMNTSSYVGVRMFGLELRKVVESCKNVRIAHRRIG